MLSTFMEYALEGYGAVLKNGKLERVPNREEATKEENIQTILAFIHAVEKKHGSLCSHLATLLLVETIQKKELLQSQAILSTYQSMLEIEEVLKKDYPFFVKLPFSKQKDYMLFMAQMKVSPEERTKLSRAFLFQSFFAKERGELQAQTH